MSRQAFTLSNKFHQEIIYGKRRGWIPYLLRGFLWGLSLIYQLAVSARNFFYDKKWWVVHRSEIPVVVSIGNLAVGGTGKTPLTVKLANTLAPFGQVSVLSRGYRSKAEKLEEPTLLSQGDGPLFSPSFCGDEPFLIAENAPHALVYVGRNRARASHLAFQQGAQVAILDDGFQHRSLDRDFDLVLLDGKELFGLNYHLPRGLLRESVKALKRAEMVVIQQTENLTFSQREMVKKITDAPVIRMELCPVQWYDLASYHPLSIQGKKVVVLCGIANPDRFLATVRREGAEIVGQLIFDDHSRYTPKDLKECVRLAIKREADLIVCTEKDKGKLSELSLPQFPIAWVKMHAEIKEGKKQWEELLIRIKQKMIRRNGE